MRPADLEIVFTRSLLLLFLVFSSLCTGQSSLSNSQAANKFAGCYELHLGRWWPWGMGEDTPLVTPPPRIELKLERGNEGFEKDRFLIREIPAASSSRRSSYWMPVGGGEALLIWTDGFSGVSLRLRKNGQDLSGWAHAHFDVVPVLPHVAHAIAKSIPCSSTR
jgi:hypothetical protein